ncbi:MAG: cytochrome c3 family protein [Raoultibacter sp.]
MKAKKWPIVVGTLALVLVMAGMGFWVWHEQPGFCGAICHTPMNTYVETYEQEIGEPGVDKWGNAVEDTSSMMAVSHRADGQTCLSCHVPTMQEQIVEGMSWVGGGYGVPLQEATLGDLTAARGLESDTFCLNESCHNLTREDLADATATMVRNPHLEYHGDIDCGTCHKAHRASVNYCSSCHSDAETPTGWITAKEEAQLLAE